MKRTFAILALAGLCGAAWCRADTLTVGIKNISGTFEGFANDAFAFRSDTGETLSENRTNVRALELDAPVKVSFELARGGKGLESSTLAAYKGMKFIFKDGDKERSFFANQIKEIRVIRPPQAGGGHAQDGGAAIRPVDISKVENNPDLTDGQKAALARYKTARAAYDDFLRESSDLVAQMDRAQGADRTKIHNRLRLRKQEEQPIINALQSAMTQLFNAFPPKDD